MQLSNKKNAIIASDMYGAFNPNHQNINYIIETEKLLVKRGYDVTIFSVPDIAGITTFTKESMHSQYISTGVEKAARTLAENYLSYDLAIGFSVGGTVFWKASEYFNKFTKELICVSSTRLRYEKKSIAAKTHLIYGGNDLYKPDIMCMQTLADSYQILDGLEHEFYHSYDLQGALF
ncbi:hypothetical protein Psal006b_01085 [Piscirickettsia salmonis]|uniref:Uncharacterized protein n=1 Tax=Piscirickettsia salmonis TaxID=1238 RepID=A0A1L6TD89_PISSA|nr:hypothetical protein [Piscirickettsia salmonis]AKP74354.1 hypothetical protein PSLF89_2775 [Piscirickettsia salmonis LF-89 = ATCC VR-1361]ALB23298.1 hypothetical protein KU39_2118 [Piscirickettsia salmonis]ALY03203.1 hypothetical protein AWE47_10405 [Piscirickettsia salmonis]AMA42766.1 hypothetical protein AWJ11_10620 [Piscirickettsia salmonis]AOS35238.1 hypothetical protein AVM72_07760 [Piscirickettsia salmonis]